MTQVRRFFSIFLLFGGVSGQVLASQDKAADTKVVKTDNCNDIQSLNWLSGRWVAESSLQEGSSLVTENWRMIASEVMRGEGMTLSLNGNKMPFIESLFAAKMGDKIFYTARPPQNKYPVSFELTNCTAQSLTFTNPTHDFPQTIEYQLINPRQIKVEVKGISGSGSNSGFNLMMRRAGASKNNSAIQTINAFVKAYNQKQLQVMLEQTTTDIQWISIGTDKLTVETQGQEALRRAMAGYFQSPLNTRSSILSPNIAGDWLFAIEKASWQKAGGNKQWQSQCSPVIYQLRNNKIAKVWYFPLVVCPES